MRHRRVDLDRAHPLADRALHAQQADAELVLHQLADRAHPAVAQVVDVVDLAAAVLDLDQVTHDGDDVLGAQHAQRVVGLEAQPHVHLDAADRRQVVALGVEEQAAEQRLGGIQGRRLARAQHPVDVEQRVLAALAAVERQGVADVGADGQVVDVEHRDLLDPRLDQPLDRLADQLVAGLGQHEAGLLVDEVARQVLADQLLVGEVQLVEALLLQLLDQPRRQLGAGLGQGGAGAGVDEVAGERLALQVLAAEPGPPALAGTVVGQLAVEGVEDGLLVETQRQQQRRHRQLAAPVDADIDEILGVELEVEPTAAVGDDAGAVEELARAVRLAPVMVEEDARAAVHLADDDALGAVDDEGAVVRHERHVAHVDVLLLDVPDASGSGLVVDVPDDQAQRHPERCRIGHAALVALLDVVLRLLELVADEIECRAVGEVLDREHRPENLLEPRQGAHRRRHVHLQEMLVGLTLHLDQVRHHRHLGNTPEALADPLLGRVRLCHR